MHLNRLIPETVNSPSITVAWVPTAVPTPPVPQDFTLLSLPCSMGEPIHVTTGESLYEREQ